VGETFGRTDRFGCRPEASTRSPNGSHQPRSCWCSLLLSFGIIFVAELGDKSQLMAMTFGLRYPWWVVLGGITAATIAVHLISVAVGHYLGAACPPTRAQRTTAPAFFAVMSAFVLAELGDKTMLATVTLAADNDWVGVWIGSTLGMVAADALAIVVGAIAGKHLPERFIQLTAAALFLAFGVGMLVGGIFPAAPIPVVVSSAASVVVLFAVILRALPKRLRPTAMRTEPVSLTESVEPGSGKEPDVRLALLRAVGPV
jgi:putative Ca2+/H+ antiporter (TMEM165/GDT1 family)